MDVVKGCTHCAHMLSLKPAAFLNASAQDKLGSSFLNMSEARIFSPKLAVSAFLLLTCSTSSLYRACSFISASFFSLQACSPPTKSLADMKPKHQYWRHLPCNHLTA